MHQDQGSAVAAGDVGHSRVEAQSAHVVDDTSARLDRLLRYLGFRGVDRNGCPLSQLPKLRGQPSNHGQDAAELFFRRNGLRSRTRGFAAHVDPVRSLSRHLETVLNGSVGVEVDAAVRKRIRRHVQHAHDERSLAQAHFSSARDEVEVETGLHSERSFQQSAISFQQSALSY